MLGKPYGKRRRPVAVAVAVAILLCTLLLLCLEENAVANATTTKPNLSECKHLFKDYFRTNCVIEMPLTMRHDSNHHAPRKPRDIDTVLQKGSSKEDSTTEFKESLTELYGNKMHPKFTGELFQSYKRSPLRRSAPTKLNKAAWKDMKDLLGFDVNNEEIADIYNDTEARAPRNTNLHGNEKNLPTCHRVMDKFHRCCPSSTCFEQHPKLRQCYNLLKNSCRKP